MRPLARLLMIAAFAASTSAEAISPSIGSGFEVERYAVVLRPNLETTSVSGSQAIDFRVMSDRLTALAFSPNALRVGQATLDGMPISLAAEKEALRFDLPKPLRKGQRATLRFTFGGKPSRGVTALPTGIYSSYFACDWMVCLQDSPGDKAHLALDLVLPAGVQSIGVGRAAKTAKLRNGLVLHRWRSTRPYSPYLYAFAAGQFARRVSTTPAGDLVYLDGTETRADLSELFAETPKLARFLAQKAGLSLPDRTYAQLLVPGSEAQESAGFSLIGMAELERARGDPGSAWVIAHEIAHAWWGNLVTCASWQDFWLNEGIANFMVAAWKEHSAGAAAYRRELDIARRRVERVRELGYDKPLAWPGTYPSLGARRAIQYSKGALFLAHLREEIGDEAFWAGLRHFTRRHAGGTVRSKDFQQAMEEASGRKLSPMFKEWVFGS